VLSRDNSTITSKDLNDCDMTREGKEEEEEEGEGRNIN
jgi:hypothetical protein